MAINESAAPLDPDHTHFNLVPGNGWGDESPCLANAATQLASNRPYSSRCSSMAEISLEQYIPNNLEAGRLTGHRRHRQRCGRVCRPASRSSDDALIHVSELIAYQKNSKSIATYPMKAPNFLEPHFILKFAACAFLGGAVWQLVDGCMPPSSNLAG